MRQDLKLSEKLFCLAVNPTNGGILMRASSTLPITLSGLVLEELRIKGLISIENGLVHLLNPTSQMDEIHEFFLNPIRLRERERKLRNWISWFNFRGRKIKKMFIRALAKKYILRIEEKRFLFIPYEKVFLMDRSLVENIRKEMENTILGKVEPNNESSILALMAFKNNLFHRIFPESELRKEATIRMKKVPETEISMAVQKAIQMMRAAAVAAST